MNLQEYLVSVSACEDAQVWAKEKTAKQAWEDCDNPDWLIWWCRKNSLNTVESVLPGIRYARVAIECAKLVLHLVPSGEDRPRLAIEAAERYLADPTNENASSAGSAASAAYFAAASAASYAAAYAASSSSAAASASYAAYFASASYAAASAAASYAAYFAAAYASSGASAAKKEMNKKICDIIRSIMVQPWTEIDFLATVAKTH